MWGIYLLIGPAVAQVVERASTNPNVGGWIPTSKVSLLRHCCVNVHAFLWWCCATPALFRGLLSLSVYDSGLSRPPIPSAWWRRERGQTFALPVVLSADASHQSLPLALRDDELEWRAYLSRLGSNKVSAPPPLIGNYLVHQEFWQLSKSHSPGHLFSL